MTVILPDLVKIQVLSSGTGPFELGAAATGFRGVEALVSGGQYSYSVQSGAQYEVGTGVYNAGTNVLVRSPDLSSNGNAAVAFGANVEVKFVARGQDLTPPGALPIVQTTGSALNVAMSQNATTLELLDRVQSIVLAALSGSSLVGFSYSEPSAPGTVASRLRRFICVNDAPYNASPSNTGAENSAAYVAAIADLDAVGGGDIWLMTPGVYIFDDINPGAPSWDNRRCIYVNTDNVALRFGKGVKLKLGDNQDAHVIQIGSRTTETLVVHNILIEGVEIDGNRANQVVPTETEDHQQGIAVQSGCTRVTIRDFYIHDCIYYGIGFQRSTFSNCLVENGLIEDVGADGIDMKDDDGTSRGNVCRAVRVRRFGLAAATIDPTQAGINPRGGWIISDCEVTEFGGDKHGIRVELGIGGTVNSFQSQVIGGYVEASATSTTVGVFLNNPNGDDCEVIGVRANGCSIGFDSRGNRNQLTSNKAVGCATGFQLYQRNQIVGNSALNCTKGLTVREDENIITNFQAIGCTTGVEFQSTAASNAWRGGQVSGNTTNVVDNGTNNAISDVIGIRTDTTNSATFAITSTGEITVSVPHNLDFTPLAQNCIPWLERDTAITDVRYGGVLVYLTDATNVYCKVYVTTVSVTAGATAKLRVNAVAKKASAQ